MQGGLRGGGCDGCVRGHELEAAGSSVSCGCGAMVSLDPQPDAVAKVPPDRHHRNGRGLSHDGSTFVRAPSSGPGAVAAVMVGEQRLTVSLRTSTPIDRGGLVEECTAVVVGTDVFETRRDIVLL